MNTKSEKTEIHGVQAVFVICSTGAKDVGLKGVETGMFEVLLFWGQQGGGLGCRLLAVFYRRTFQAVDGGIGYLVVSAPPAKS